VVIDEEERSLYQQRVRKERGEILRAVAPSHDNRQGIVVASTSNWYWLVEGLLDAGSRVHWANTTASEQ